MSCVRRPCVALLFPDAGRNAAPKPGRLIVPGQRPPPTPPPPPIDPAEGDAKRTTFRPPMGYFLKTTEKLEELEAEAEVMLQSLRSSAGRWHELAVFIPKLAAAGYDASLLEELTGIPKPEQSVLVTAASVLQSIRGSYTEKGLPCDDDMFAYFDVEGSHFALYELRFLNVEERVSCGQYVAQHRLHASEAQDLARATKEYLRRGGESTGFERSPEDILAYKFYRHVQLRDLTQHRGGAALESRESSLISSFVQKGLKVAESAFAREKLEAILTGHEKIAEKGREAAAKIHIYRLLTLERNFRPLPYAGDLTEVEAARLRECPTARSVGEFGVFETTPTERPWKWLTLPRWPLYATAKQPVALSIKNCAAVPELQASVQAKSQGEALRLSGRGMLIADVAVQSADDAESYYLTSAEGRLRLTAGGEMGQGEVLGKILFVCRPPDRDSEY